MAVKCQTVINLIENFASRKLAEEWDNPGLNIGNPSSEVGAVLIALDVDSEVVKEAIDVGAGLIISHHPLIFKPLKNLREDNPQGRLICEIIRSGINIYCAHTNLDSCREGVNDVLADLLGLQSIEVLNPDKPDIIYKLVVFVPESHTEQVREAITGAGAGWIGNYSDCTFLINGTGTFKATDGCNPFLGKPGLLEKTAEVRLETVIRQNQVNKVIRSMIKAHPYEEVAYDIYPLVNDAGRLGIGRIGTMENAMSFDELLKFVKQTLNIPVLRYGGELDQKVKKIAVCGGSGGSFIHKASFAGADVLLTGDMKYHEAQEALALGLKFIDAGHFATEVPVLTKVHDYLKRTFISEGISIPLFISKTNKDSISYF